MSCLIFSPSIHSVLTVEQHLSHFITLNGWNKTFIHILYMFSLDDIEYGQGATFTVQQWVCVASKDVSLCPAWFLGKSRLGLQWSSVRRESYSWICSAGEGRAEDCDEVFPVEAGKLRQRRKISKCQVFSWNKALFLAAGVYAHILKLKTPTYPQTQAV